MAQVNILPEETENKIYFTENKGQWPNDISFKFSSSDLHILLKDESISYYFLNPKNVADANEHGHKLEKKEIVINGNYLSVLFKNANKSCFPISNGEAENSYKNYFLGNDKSKWKSKVYSYQNIIYPNIYNQIDLQINTSKSNVLKYDWIVKPNANLTDIKLQITGADSVYLNYDELYISHSQGILKEQKPFAYQIIEGKRVLVNVKYILKNNCIGFESEHYNQNYNLVIDPDLIFSTYSGSTEDNFGYTATYDSKGNLLAGGITTDEFGGTYPVTPGAFQLIYKGGVKEGPVYLPCDITISKYSSDGKQLIYATYLGGKHNEYPHSLVVDNNDNLVVMGTTKSIDFPVSSKGYDTSHNGNYDFIIIKFNADGTALLGSTYFGGYLEDGWNSDNSLYTFYADHFRGDVIIDNANNIIVGSCSFSMNFPITSGSFGAAISDTLQKGVVFKLSPNCENLIFSSALQGTNKDVIYSIDLNSNQDIFIAGSTTNNIIGSNATNSYFGGQSDGFFAKIKNDGSTILKLKYFGTPSVDQIYSLELDNDENIYVIGNSLGNIQPIGNVYSVPNGKQFISKINKDFNTIEYISTFGTGKVGFDVSINAFLLDDCGRIYMSSWAGTFQGTEARTSTFGLPITSDALQKTTDGRDFYLMVMSQNAEKILYASFFGGNLTGDHVDGGTSRFDKRGYIYQSVCASCPNFNGEPTISDFPTSSDAVFKTNVSPRCSNAAFKMSFRFNDANILYSFDTCANTVTLNTPTENALNYLWLLPNNKTSNLRSPILEIDEINNQEIVLILNSGTTCADTAKATIHYADSLNKVKTANVFTPNNDGINDYFKIDGLAKCGEAEIIIFNRWGQEIFKSSDKDFNWDGKTTNGEPVSEGVYFYLGSFKKQFESTVKLHGTITIIR
ncbi:MAG: gliding motility-associated C-terminal domain-containing protein [Bacteroidia bacterium]